MLPSFFTDSVTIVTPAEIESNGKTRLDWSTTTETVVTGCYVEPAASDRDFDGRQVSVADEWVLRAPAGTSIPSNARIVWNGDTYQINGAAMQWRSPSGALTHVQARLKRWAG